MKIESHITVGSHDDDAVTLLQQETGLSKQRIKYAMAQGAVWLTRGRDTQRLRRAKRALRAGDEIHLYYDADILAEEPPEPALVADVGDYSVWNKPYGLRSQGSKWGDHCTVVRWAERNLEPERPAFTVHRLDRAANGLILVAHSKRSAAALSTLFRTREVEKRYRARIAGSFANEPMRIETPIDGKPAVSEVSLIEVSGDGRESLVNVSIETGRKHQIRRHLAGRPMRFNKKTGAGARERNRVIRQMMPSLSKQSERLLREITTVLPRRIVSPDDVLDAIVLLLTAMRIGRQEALRVPDDPPRDRRGLRMEIWY